MDDRLPGDGGGYDTSKEHDSNLERRTISAFNAPNIHEVG